MKLDSFTNYAGVVLNKISQVLPGTAISICAGEIAGYVFKKVLLEEKKPFDYVVPALFSSSFYVGNRCTNWAVNRLFKSGKLIPGATSYFAFITQLGLNGILASVLTHYTSQALGLQYKLKTEDYLFYSLVGSIGSLFKATQCFNEYSYSYLKNKVSKKIDYYLQCKEAVSNKKLNVLEKTIYRQFKLLNQQNFSNFIESDKDLQLKIVRVGLKKLDRFLYDYNEDYGYEKLPLEKGFSYFFESFRTLKLISFLQKNISLAIRINEDDINKIDLLNASKKKTNYKLKCLCRELIKYAFVSSFNKNNNKLIEFEKQALRLINSAKCIITAFSEIYALLYDFKYNFNKNYEEFAAFFINDLKIFSIQKNELSINHPWKPLFMIEDCRVFLNLILESNVFKEMIDKNKIFKFAEEFENTDISFSKVANDNLKHPLIKKEIKRIVKENDTSCDYPMLIDAKELTLEILQEKLKKSKSKDYTHIINLLFRNELINPVITKNIFPFEVSDQDFSKIIDLTFTNLPYSPLQIQDPHLWTGMNLQRFSLLVAKLRPQDHIQFTDHTLGNLCDMEITHTLEENGTEEKFAYNSALLTRLCPDFNIKSVVNFQDEDFYVYKHLCALSFTSVKEQMANTPILDAFNVLSIVRNSGIESIYRPLEEYILERLKNTPRDKEILLSSIPRNDLLSILDILEGSKLREAMQQVLSEEAEDTKEVKSLRNLSSIALSISHVKSLNFTRPKKDCIKDSMLPAQIPFTYGELKFGSLPAHIILPPRVKDDDLCRFVDEIIDFKYVDLVSINQVTLKKIRRYSNLQTLAFCYELTSGSLEPLLQTLKSLKSLKNLTILFVPSKIQNDSEISLNQAKDFFNTLSEIDTLEELKLSGKFPICKEENNIEEETSITKSPSTSTSPFRNLKKLFLNSLDSLQLIPEILLKLTQSPNLEYVGAMEGETSMKFLKNLMNDSVFPVNPRSYILDKDYLAILQRYPKEKIRIKL